MSKIKIAIVGVGNCASALVQGLVYYADKGTDVPGVMFKDIGGYTPQDIEVVAAFDVDARKVGVGLGEAIFAQPNNTRVFIEPEQASHLNEVKVEMGNTLDGVATHMLTVHDEVNFRPLLNKTVSDVVQILKDKEVDVLINYLPVGSQKATEYYAECALEAKVPFLNCIPVFIASDPTWEAKFRDAGIPIVGDDMKSQFGASITSQVLQETLFDRGHNVQFHQQLNVGGNSDFANMLDSERIKSKKTSKENVIRSQHDIRGMEAPKDSLYAGPSSFIPYLKDNKVAYLRIEATGFGGSPVEIDVKLSVIDSPNSAGVVLDAIRFLKVAQELGISGALKGPSAWTQKTPPVQLTIKDSKAECDALAKREKTELMGR